MGRKLNCSKRKKRIALNEGPLLPTLPTRGEKTRTRRIKNRLRMEIRDLMECAYALYHGYNEPRMSQVSNRYISYYYFPDTPDKREFFLTYIGSGIWDHLDSVSIDDLRRAHSWATCCHREMQDRYRTKRFKRRCFWTFSLLVLGGVIAIFSL